MGWSTRKLITKAGEGGGRGLFGLGKSVPIINSSINKGMHEFKYVVKFQQYLKKGKPRKDRKKNPPFFEITLQSSSLLKTCVRNSGHRDTQQPCVALLSQAGGAEPHCSLPKIASATCLSLHAVASAITVGWVVVL